MTEQQARSEAEKLTDFYHNLVPYPAIEHTVLKDRIVESLLSTDKNAYQRGREDGLREAKEAAKKQTGCPGGYHPEGGCSCDDLIPIVMAITSLQPNKE